MGVRTEVIQRWGAQAGTAALRYLPEPDGLNGGGGQLLVSGGGYERDVMACRVEVAARLDECDLGGGDPCARRGQKSPT
ncbi:hypothetical protein AB0M46_24125 [Dactylosporangium sp. NPDC051485]|uniref:hypothetical protein n=1 Tax=Dactylosporangium sp. NPDC051485 TaxID=3154846 RepID=UPI0034449D97